MKVTNLWFNDVLNAEDWSPTDPNDFEESIGLTVGDENGGTDFQVQVCTPVSIKRLEKKRYIFMIEKWRGLPDLIRRFDAFIREIETDPTIDLYNELSKHWLWEYEGMSGR